MKTPPLLKEFDYFLAWIIFFLTSAILGAIAGAIGGFIIGIIMGSMGASIQAISIAGMVVGFILGLPVSYLCFRLVVNKFIVQKIQDEAYVRSR